MPRSSKVKPPFPADYPAAYKAVIDGPRSVVCQACSNTLFGDDPAVYVICPKCWPKREQHDAHTAYPDGR